jgi:hypothetical protein
MTTKLLEGFRGRQPPEEVCPRPKNRILSEILRFLRRHLVHLLFFVPGAFILVTVHESTHAVVALARGGIIQEIHLLPALQNWGGSVSYKLPGAQETSWAVSLAPYVVCLSLAVITTGIAVRRSPKSNFVASCWFVWGFIMPLEDLLNTALTWSQGVHNDFYEALGPSSSIGILATGTLIILCLAWGAWVQSAIYSDQRLSWRAWWVLSGSTMTAFVALSFIAFHAQIRNHPTSSIGV